MKAIIWIAFWMTVSVNYISGYPASSRPFSAEIHLSENIGRFCLRKVRDMGRIQIAYDCQFSTWTVWELFNNNQLMFGLNHNNMWYFMEPVGSTIRISQSQPPVGAILPNDRRLFEYVKRHEDNSFLLRHVATGQYVKVDRHGLVKLTLNCEYENCEHAVGVKILRLIFMEYSI